jgi:hypothetical protein
MPAKPLALLITTGPRGPAPSLPYAPPLEQAGYAVEQRAIIESSSLRQLLSTLRIRAAIRRYDLVVANEYSTAIGLGLLAVIFRARARMVVLSLNLSRRALKLRLSPVQRLIDRSLRRYHAIVVHSARRSRASSLSTASIRRRSGSFPGASTCPGSTPARSRRVCRRATSA